MKREDLSKKLYLMTKEEGECWIFTGPLNDKGYGTLWRRRIDRLVYERIHLTRWKGKTLWHTCLRTACIRPDHMKLVTHEGAHTLMKEERRKRCRKGHIRIGTSYYCSHCYYGRKQGIVA